MTAENWLLAQHLPHIHRVNHKDIPAHLELHVPMNGSGLIKLWD